MATKVFEGANVFMSRKLVPPELFDSLHDALKLNGAQVFLCCDSSRNGTDDYHVISSSDHEKFENLRSKGCNLIGPQCVFSCAKERRVLPKQGFTCCLGMDGVNILASGFEKDDRDSIEKMVTAMGGVWHTKASSEINFVVVQNVLAKKYKWALNSLKKPIVSIQWILQCWKEHRVVPQDSYRVLPFSGLTICVSGLPADERKGMEKLVMENGGKYSAELNKGCTHLICDVPQGDKYKVAKRWGHIYIVSRKWFHQSVARRACLSEESYLVQASSVSSLSTVKTEQHSQGKGVRTSQYMPSPMATASDLETNFSAHDTEPDLENFMPNIYSTLSDAPPSPKGGIDLLADKGKDDSKFAQCVADDSQSEDDDLYLSECRILLVGFEASELRKLVDMVRRGGGSRYMSFQEKLTHIVVGNPSEIEIKEVRGLAAFGIIYVVKTAWLEECTLKKKEVPVLQSHIAFDLLLPKEPIFSKRTTTSTTGVKQGKASVSKPVEQNTHDNINSQSEVLLHKKDYKLKVQSESCHVINHTKSSTVFEGKLFRFSSSFPVEQRPEVELWVKNGGGEVVTDQNEKNVHFTIEKHGVAPCLTNIAKSTCVSSHWIHSCLEGGRLLDVSSHMIYSPLHCQIPLPGFKGYRLCVSLYDTKEKQLLRNLCYVLGGQFSTRLTKKVTHLLCKFADGDKYEAACRWGMHTVTSEWIYECVLQNKVVDLERFHPKELTSQDREAGHCSVSQYPSQTVRMTSVDVQALNSTDHTERDGINNPNNARKKARLLTDDNTDRIERDDINNPNIASKKARLLIDDSTSHPLSYASITENFVDRKNTTENIVTENIKEVSAAVPDVAAAIEDLLEQTSKIQDRQTEETSHCHENFLSSNCTMLRQELQSDPGPSKHWMNRLDKGDDNNPSAEVAAKGLYDGFSETQTDSQVVGYEEDLSGRQMIIDRVRTRSSLT